MSKRRGRSLKPSRVRAVKHEVVDQTKGKRGKLLMKPGPAQKKRIL